MTDDRQACAVCGRILDFHEATKTWEHTVMDAGADHPAVAVPIGQIPDQLRVRCDFCSEGPAPWFLPVASFPWPSDPDRISEGDWAACDTCAAMIDRNDWNGVVRRALAINDTTHPFVEQELRKMYRILRKNITGALRKDA